MKLYELIEGRNDPHTHKAIFMLGGPGSGKTHVASKIAGGTGLRSVNVDEFYEMLRSKQGVGGGFDDELYKYSGNLTQKKLDLLLKGRIGLVIDGTGRKVDRLSEIKQQLEEIGYDTMAVFVNTDINTALDRNDQRVRKADNEWVRKVHTELKLKLGELQNIFGSNMLIVDNTDDRTDFGQAQKSITKFLNTPNTRPASWPVQESYKVLQNEQERADLYKKVSAKIMHQAKSYIGEVRQPLQLLYRGYEMFADQPFQRDYREDREPKDSSKDLTNIFNLAIDSAGGKADRNNAIFVSGNARTASIYGQVYVVFPMGNFDYTWHKDIDDWFNEIPIGGEGAGSGIRNEHWKEVEKLLGWKTPLKNAYEISRKYDNYERTKEEGEEPPFPLEVVQAVDKFIEIQQGLVIDKGLSTALNYGREVMISCPGGYYYIPEKDFFKYVAPYLEINGLRVEDIQIRK